VTCDPRESEPAGKIESAQAGHAISDYPDLAAKNKSMLGLDLLLMTVVMLVVGVTTWLALTTEISLDDTSASYKTIRIAILAALGLAVVLFTAMMTRTILNRRQALALVRNIALANERLESEIALRGRMEQILLANEAFVSSVMDTVVDAILTTDAGGTIETINSQAEKIFRYKAKDLLGENLALLVAIPYRKRLIRQLEKYRCNGKSRLVGSTQEVMGRRKSGRTFPMELSIVEMKLGGQCKLVTVARDISKHKRLERKLLALSAQDGLTGIANRRTFDSSLEAEWRRAIRHELPLGLVMIDIDFFKRYNDSLGHLAGDECLKSVAHVIQDLCRRPGDLVARYGGEEFVGLLPETSRHGILHIAAKIRSAVEAADIVHPASITADVVTVSVGAALMTPRQGENPETIISRADQALYKAKSSGRNRVIHFGEDGLQ
jgi:diguanylate cyclase (GGDEF)-like protein/PAS domain S-box-containing protein